MMLPGGAAARRPRPSPHAPHAPDAPLPLLTCWCHHAPAVCRHDEQQQQQHHHHQQQQEQQQQHHHHQQQQQEQQHVLASEPEQQQEQHMDHHHLQQQGSLTHTPASEPEQQRPQALPATRSLVIVCPDIDCGGGSIDIDGTMTLSDVMPRPAPHAPGTAAAPLPSPCTTYPCPLVAIHCRASWSSSSAMMKVELIHLSPTRLLPMLPSQMPFLVGWEGNVGAGWFPHPRKMREPGYLTALIHSIVQLVGTLIRWSAGLQIQAAGAPPCTLCNNLLGEVSVTWKQT